MTCYVDITTVFRGGQRGSGTASVIIWTEKAGERHEAGPFYVSVVDETRNRLAILAVNEALKHFTRPGQDIIIRMRETYVRANLQYLDGWHEKDYQKKEARLWRMRTNGGSCGCTRETSGSLWKS